MSHDSDPLTDAFDAALEESGPFLGHSANFDPSSPNNVSVTIAAPERVRNSHVTAHRPNASAPGASSLTRQAGYPFRLTPLQKAVVWAIDYQRRNVDLPSAAQIVAGLSREEATIGLSTAKRALEEIRDHDRRTAA